MRRLTSTVLMKATYSYFVAAVLFCTVHGYTPSDNVKAAHKTPHLDTALNMQDSSPAYTYEYVSSLIVFPLIFAAAGVLALLVFPIAHLFRCCVPCCKGCIPNPDDVETTASKDVRYTDR
jgi:hypothetical protein